MHWTQWTQPTLTVSDLQRGLWEMANSLCWWIFYLHRYSRFSLSSPRISPLHFQRLAFPAVPGGWSNWYHWLSLTLMWPKHNKTHMVDFLQMDLAWCSENPVKLPTDLKLSKVHNRHLGSGEVTDVYVVVFFTGSVRPALGSGCTCGRSSVTPLFLGVPIRILGSAACTPLGLSLLLGVFACASVVNIGAILGSTCDSRLL